MSQDTVNIEVDGKPLVAQKGQMLIQVTDRAGVYVPRFCYHDKLSIAANCRMCLVEVEKAPKPMPACATPVAEGMKVFTRSPRALAAQKATMEFLLINHPLDCPICDQGGECELQDLAQGFGSDSSRFDERKRVVKDKDLGPLISTDMTRCIHCTRCVRFTAEVAGLQELGATGRGEWMEIGTWIERSVDHELSGNVIDLCPVGALNSKPFRHRARSWEMTEHPLVSPHDAAGSNLYGHVLRGRLMRVVPRANEDVNETWISDRDRFSYEGVYAADRLERPMVREGSQWRELSWEDALAAAAEGLKTAVGEGADGAGFLGSPSATTEELYLLARLARGLGSHNVDSRLRQRDFSGQQDDPPYPGLGLALKDLERLDGLLLVGCQPRSESPIVAHRIRQGATRHGTKVAWLTVRDPELLFPTSGIASSPDRMVAELAGIARAAAEAAGKTLPATVAGAAGEVTDAQREAAAALAAGERRAILMGGVAMRHTRYADLCAVASALAALTGATLGYLPDGANAAGAAIAGALPHRLPGGQPDPEAGLDVAQMLLKPRRALLLFGGIEPDEDIAPGALQAVGHCPFVVAATPYAGEALRSVAQLLLPIGTFAETSGTYVSAEGRWQSFRGCARPVGEARPGWKVLRVLGNLLGIGGFEYEDSEQVRDQLQRLASGVAFDGRPSPIRNVNGAAGGDTIELPIYGVDAIVRRAPALQQTRTAREGVAP